MIIEQVKLIGIIEWEKEHVKFNEKAKKYDYLFDEIKNHINQGCLYFCFLKAAIEINVIISQENPNNILILILPINNKLKEEFKEELEDVINSSFDGIVIADAKGIILYQNPSYERITGLSTEFCIGKNLQELVDIGVIDISASLKAIREKRSVTISQKIENGRSVLVTAVPITNKQGEIIKIVNNVRDLTQLSRLEVEIHELEIENKKISKELQQLKQNKDPKYSIIAHSSQMKEVLNRAMRIAQIDSGVLIQGPSGVGKEKVLDLIHLYSIRKDGPLIKINCGAIPENLLESELFGYESGTFTGAIRGGKSGLFEFADKGTIFLDEIGEMPLQLQVKLLRILQEREVVRIGGKKPIPIDVRVVAATNKNLLEMIANGTFREDLYYRLNIVPIEIPPLEKRKEDIIPLIYHFINDLNLKYGLNKNFSREVLDQFVNYNWPGNVRELQNIVERVVLMSQGSIITIEDLHKELNMSNIQLVSGSQLEINDKVESNIQSSLKEHVESFEEELIRDVIKNYPSIRKAAVALKIDQSTLVRKMQKYNIDNSEKSI